MSVVGVEKEMRLAGSAKHKAASALKSNAAQLGAKADGVITPSGRFTNLDPVKLRGGYYTPAPLSAWLAEWGIRKPTDKVLEPSCGDGNLLIAAAERLLSLGASRRSVGMQLQGVELSSVEAHVARTRLTELLAKPQPEIVQAGDFFGWWDQYQSADRRYDVVIGNPPFIRYQAFPEP